MTKDECNARRAYYANKRRVDLLRKIAKPGPKPETGVCAKCGDVHLLAALTVQHVDGITWNRYELSSHRRYAKYWRELQAGVRLAAWCTPCNSSDGEKHKQRLRRERKGAAHGAHVD